MQCSWRLIVCRSKVTLVDNCFFAFRGFGRDETPPAVSQANELIDEAPHVAADAAPPSPATTHAAASICSQDDVYTRLANLMEWKQRGWLSETEFGAAKVLLLQAPSP